MPHSPVDPARSSAVTSPQYNVSALNIEKRLKHFLSQWHGKAEDLNHFEPQEFDLELEDRSFEELLEGARDVNGRHILPFNRDFLTLFKDIVLVPPTGSSRTYRPNKDLLWVGVLEAKSSEEGDRQREELNYSLFCFNKNQSDPPGFFAAHRLYQLLIGELLGLTEVFLHEEVVGAGREQDQRRVTRFRPLYVGVRPDINAGRANPSGHPEDMPYGMSDGILLDQELTLAVDHHLEQLDVRRLAYAGDLKGFMRATVNTHEEVLRGSARRFFDLRSGSGPLGRLKKAVADVKFVYYLIWLRALGVVGGAKENWVDYFYFRVPDLSGYLHTVTVATKTPLDSSLFHLIDRKSPSLFHRSLLRLAVREKELRKQVETHARRAAVVAVMSRNMSHNIGSHVLAGLTSKEQLADSNLDEVAALNSYLQARMDFLADLATSSPVITLPKRLYSDVCIYLTPSSANDDRVQWQKLLMDRISGSTAVRRGQIKLRVKVRGPGQERQVSLTTAGLDPVVAFPNDMLGAHALYVILENMIRNCVKHSRIKANSKLEVTAIVTEESDEYWRVRVFDNLAECASDDALADRLTRRIEMPVLNPDASLRLGGWGMMEMKIAAAYLRKIAPADVDAEHRPPLLTAVNHDGNLGLEFYLLRPKEALVIEAQGDTFHKLRRRVEQFGVDVVKDAGTRADTRHDFLIIDSPTEGQLAELRRRSEALPGRVFVCRNGAAEKYGELRRQELLKILGTGMAQDIRSYLWREWVAAGAEGERLPSIKKAMGSGPPVTLLGDEDRPWNECIIFDNHGEHFGRLTVAKEAMYYEPYESKSPTGLILSKLPDDESLRQTLLFELIEAARLRVVVVDERIQHESTKPDTVIKSCENNQVLGWMKIIVPQPTVMDLNKQKFSAADRTALEKHLESLSARSDVLLIHLGVVEKLLGSTEETEVDRWLSDWKARFRSLVVTSGRGRPSNLPTHMRFLHYSLVSRYIFQERSKYHLCKVLFASRRIP